MLFDINGITKKSSSPAKKTLAGMRKKPRTPYLKRYVTKGSIDEFA